jgi:uncharacterized protein with PIN domain
MSDRKMNRCARCGKRLRKGGDNFNFACTITADFDGYINISPGPGKIEKTIQDIELSGLTAPELEQQVYFDRRFKLCFDCRNEVEKIIRGIGSFE